MFIHTASCIDTWLAIATVSRVRVRVSNLNPNPIPNPNSNPIPNPNPNPNPTNRNPNPILNSWLLRTLAIPDLGYSGLSPLELGLASQASHVYLPRIAVYTATGEASCVYSINLCRMNYTGEASCVYSVSLCRMNYEVCLLVFRSQKYVPGSNANELCYCLKLSLFTVSIRSMFLFDFVVGVNGDESCRFLDNSCCSKRQCCTSSGRQS